jgi:WD40 repeat protein
VAFSSNGLFAVSGSEDKTARVWGLTLGLVVSVFKVSQKKYFLGSKTVGCLQNSIVYVLASYAYVPYH